MEICARPALSSLVTVLVTAGQLVRAALTETEKRIEAEAYDGSSGAWNEKQIETFTADLLDRINEFRDKYGLGKLELDPALTKAATLFVADCGSLTAKHIEADPSLPWVYKTRESTRIKDLQEFKALKESAILYTQKGSRHLKHYFLKLLKDTDPASPLLPGKHPGFTNDRYAFGTTVKDNYCKRLKQLLWAQTTKMGFAVKYIPGSGTTGNLHTIFFEPSRGAYEIDTYGLKPSVIPFLKTTNKCRMDYAELPPGESYSINVFYAIVKLRSAFGITTPFKYRPKLTEQAEKFAGRWAIMGKSGDTSAFKGFILYAQRTEKRTSAADMNLDQRMQWDKQGVIASTETETPGETSEIRFKTCKTCTDNLNMNLINVLVKVFMKHLLAADKFGVPFTLANSPGNADTTTEAANAPRLSQLLCKDATEFGFGLARYVFNYYPLEHSNDWTNHFVLLFDTKCDTLPAVSGSIGKKLKAKGWTSESNGNWFFSSKPADLPFY